MWQKIKAWWDFETKPQYRVVKEFRETCPYSVERFDKFFRMWCYVPGTLSACPSEAKRKMEVCKKNGSAKQVIS